MMKYIFYSYVVAIMKMSSYFKRYANEVPPYLWDRPKAFIVHCLENLDKATREDKTGIALISQGVFSIRSFTDVAKTYRHLFGDDDTMPSCTCGSWKSTAFLCKQSFAVFLKFNDWRWEKLSSLYRCSPFLSIDYFGGPVPTVPNEERQLEVPIVEFSSEEDIVESNESSVAEIEQQTVELGRPRYSNPRTSLKRCHQLLDDIKRLMYYTQDQPGVLGELSDSLLEMRKQLQSNIPNEMGINTRPVSEREKWRKPDPPPPVASANSLMMKKRKQPQKNRKRVEQCKKQKIAVVEEIEPLVTEEVVSEPIEGEKIFTTTPFLQEVSDEEEQDEESTASLSALLSARTDLTIIDLQSISEKDGEMRHSH